MNFQRVKINPLLFQGKCVKVQLICPFFFENNLYFIFLVLFYNILKNIYSLKKGSSLTPYWLSHKNWAVYLSFVIEKGMVQVTRRNVQVRFRAFYGLKNIGRHIKSVTVKGLVRVHIAMIYESIRTYVVTDISQYIYTFIYQSINSNELITHGLIRHLHDCLHSKVIYICRKHFRSCDFFAQSSEIVYCAKKVVVENVMDSWKICDCFYGLPF